MHERTAPWVTNARTNDIIGSRMNGMVGSNQPTNERHHHGSNQPMHERTALLDRMHERTTSLDHE